MRVTRNTRLHTYCTGSWGCMAGFDHPARPLPHQRGGLSEPAVLAGRRARAAEAVALAAEGDLTSSVPGSIVVQVQTTPPWAALADPKVRDDGPDHKQARTMTRWKPHSPR